MAYAGTTSTSPNAPRCVSQGIVGTKTWFYDSTHVSSDVEAANFFTDGLELGMAVGDMLIHKSTAGIITSHTILTVSATGTDLSVGTTIGLGA